VINSIIIY